MVAVAIYGMTVKTGHFDVRRSFASVSDDQRIGWSILLLLLMCLLVYLQSTPVLGWMV